MRRTGDALEAAKDIVCRRHYSRSVPAGKSHWFQIEEAFICFSIPANRNIARFLLGWDGNVWELARMWAPTFHDRNLLTRAIAGAVKELREVEPTVEALVSYADPNNGHAGGVYKAGSWAYTGRSEEGRYYVDENGQTFSRRAFHSGSTGLKKAEIEALGFRQLTRPGKHRYARGLTKQARKAIETRSAFYETAGTAPEEILCDCGCHASISGRVDARHCISCAPPRTSDPAIFDAVP